MHPDLVVALLIPAFVAAAGYAVMRRRSRTTLGADVAALEEENDQLRAELAATRERLDFAERLLEPRR